MPKRRLLLYDETEDSGVNKKLKPNETASQWPDGKPAWFGHDYLLSAGIKMTLPAIEEVFGDSQRVLKVIQLIEHAILKYGLFGLYLPMDFVQIVKEDFSSWFPAQVSQGLRDRVLLNLLDKTRVRVYTRRYPAKPTWLASKEDLVVCPRCRGAYESLLYDLHPCEENRLLLVGVKR